VRPPPWQAQSAPPPTDRDKKAKVTKKLLTLEEKFVQAAK
jgi:hypothetical protein